MQRNTLQEKEDGKMVTTLTITAKAMELGAEHGKSCGSWVIDGNTSNETAQKIIDGYDNGDPEVMDYCPSPLSGEFADDPTVHDVLKELGVLWSDDRADDLINAYEEAFQSAWWATVIQSCYGMLPDYEPCGVCKLYGHKAKDHD